MLEKLGLPAKPSMRGNNWVIDASHCQGCSSQFTLLNRKHHCRRCGGLFCNSCTQQRMILRGQGDSPVRICDPCKKLEDAARFEARHGNRNRAVKGSLQVSHKHEDEVLNQILGADGKQTSLSGRESTTDMVSGIHKSLSSASCSNAAEGVLNLDREGEPHGLDEIESHSPEKLRQQAQEEKKKYSILKKEGNPGEALRAFKRGKELERQAEALEIALRKSRRKNLSSSSLHGTQKPNDVPEGSVRKNKLSQEQGKEKDDLALELKELGWSDADLHDEGKKPAKVSLEGELSDIVGENRQKSSIGRGSSGGIDKSQVIEHKKKALMFKREGKLAEAKEELKRAKILEKQLEEQEFLVQDESDDELSSLIQAMDDDKEDMTTDFAGVSGFNFGNLGVDTDDLAVGGDFEVTDDDMNDPEIAAALKSFGWIEDANKEEKIPLQPASVDREALQREVLALKREALNQKRAGNVADAMAQLKKAKLLEKDLENLPFQGLSSTTQNLVSAENRLDLNLVTEATLTTTLDDNDELMSYGESIKIAKPPRKNRAVIQKELLGLKKRALALRREGKLDEAEEELRKCKVLELQLKELENPTAVEVKHGSSVGDLVLGEEDVDVSEQDMHDPALLSVLKNLGWDEDDDEASKTPLKNSKQIYSNSESSGVASIVTGQAPRNKVEIQRELLGLKRQALLLRRQGKSEEVEEELRKARNLENQLAEMEVSQHMGKKVAEELTGVHKHEDPAMVVSESKPVTSINETETKLGLPLLQILQTDASTNLKEKIAIGDEISSVEPVTDIPKRIETHVANPVTEPGSLVDRTEQSSRGQEILAHKRKALALKREGKLAEAREELQKAKILEKSVGDDRVDIVNDSRTVLVPKDVPNVLEMGQEKTHKPLSSRDRFKLQQESLAHKRQALKLRREGRIEESEAEFELAKSLEMQMESGSHDSKTQKSVGEEDGIVDDLFDPQLLSALKGIGWQESDIFEQKPGKSDSKIENLNQERSELEERIKAEKVQALNLKRAGKQGEALDALRRAKAMEKKLNSLAL